MEEALNANLNRAILAGRDFSRSGTRFQLPRHVLGRLYLFPVVLTFDSLLISTIPHSFALLGPLAICGIVAYAVFIGLGYSQLKPLREDIPFNSWFFVAHFLCVGVVCVGNFATSHEFVLQFNATAEQFTARALLLLGILLLAIACLPFRSWIVILHATSPSWVFAGIAGICAGFLRSPMQSFWDTSSNGVGRFLQAITFQSVGAVLRTVMPGVIVDPFRFRVGTSNFAVIVARQCSGIEGLGLVLVFTIVWLAYFRKESRFPQALLLIPGALVAVWVLNVFRICLLIMIGDAGAPEVAMLGFHSQAGWIAFTTVAFAFSMATRRLSWVRKMPTDAVVTGESLDDAAAIQTYDELGESPAARAYLIPFLAILAASFLSKAVSGTFEWLYPLRFLCAAVALWSYRSELRKLNWHFGWIALLTGAGVFLVWLIPFPWTGHSSLSSLGASLAALSTPARLTWIAFRVAAATITVPIAEELAFRGFLIRRLIDREFDRIPLSTLTPVSVGVSSVAFGLLHGQHWLVGIIAGLAYAALLSWRGRIGDAVAAHAVSNLLLATWVLLRGDWTLWQ